MASIYHRALVLACVVCASTLAVFGLTVASSAAFVNAQTALVVRESVERARVGISEFRRTRSAAQATQAFEALAEGRAAARQLDGRTDTLSVVLASYTRAAGRLEALMTDRGLTQDAGVEGAFRNRVHAVEANVQHHGSGELLVPVLQARRREKDFMLRGDPTYVAQVRAHVAEAAAAARASLAPAAADSVAGLLLAYETGFLDLVRITTAVDVQAAQLDRLGAQAQAISTDVTEAATRRARLLEWLALAAALATSALVSILGAWQALGVARPVAHLRDAAARIAAGEAAVSVPEVGPEEVRTLARALNGVAAHVDRRTAAEAQLAEAQRFTETVLGQAQEGVVAFDTDYRIVYANPYAERLYGTTLEAVKGRRPDELFTYIQDHGRRALFERALAGDVVGSPDICVEIGGRNVWLTAVYAPLCDESGAVRGVVSTVHDVTDRVEAAAELRAAVATAEAAARLKSSLLANMSHEIRTPLTGILGYADLLAEEATPDTADLVGVIQRNGQRLLDTLNSVLDLAQLESGTMQVRCVPVDASALAASTAELFADAAARKGVALTVEAGPTVHVLADAVALGRVLANLVSNAVKFTDAGAVRVRLGVGLGVGVGEGFVDVSDTGVGMSEAFLGRIFGEFEQESEGHARAYEGNGLGLAIVRRLVDLMGGRIAVESTRGAGSAFRVWLPLAEAPASGSDAPRVPAGPEALGVSGGR